MSKNAHNQAPLKRRPGQCGFRRAFTLVELLAVMTIITVTMVAVVPALQGFTGKGSVNEAVYDIAGTLDQARAYAMANNTYVFVGLTERNAMNPAQPGNGQVLVAVMGSKNGTRSFGVGNANLVSLAKLRRLGNVHLEDSVTTAGNMSRPALPNTSRVANGAFQAQDSFVVSGYQFTKIIQFDPRGMASIQSGSAPVPLRMEIGLVATRGDIVAGSENCAAVLLDGVTGSTKIYRP